VECLGSVFQHLPVSDRVFYTLNSYYHHEQKRQDLLDRACAELGAEMRFTLLFLSHFEANLANGAPTDFTYQRIAEAGGTMADQAGLAREIAGTGFHLSAGFRDSTTPSYFELLGYSHEYQALVNADWLGHGSNRRFVRSLTQLFWEATGKV
jgi:hypothetical protein